jgi:hypothetical protein
MARRALKQQARRAQKMTPPGVSPGRCILASIGHQVGSFGLTTLDSLGGDRAAHLGDRRRRRHVGGSRAIRSRTAGGLAAAVAGIAGGLAAAVASVAGRLAAARAAAAVPMATLLGRVERLQKVTDRGVLLAAARATARGRTTARLAATGTSVAGGLAAAVASVAGRLEAAVTSVAGGLAAAVTGIAGRLAAAVAAAMVLPLALLEQPLQATEEVMLAAHPSATARRTAAAVASVAGRLVATSTGIAGRLAATSTSVAAGLAAASAGIAAGLAAASTSVAAGLTARGAALAAEHPIKELETEGLATNGHAENQRTEKHHTLHRATSPLLVDHRGVRPARDAVTPRL